MALDEAAAEDGAAPFSKKAPVKALVGAPPSPALRLEQLADGRRSTTWIAHQASQKRKRRKSRRSRPAEGGGGAGRARRDIVDRGFQSPERVAEQKRQEFELLMQDVVYESGSSLTDLRLLEGLRGKKKKGQSVFATGFWTKLFKPPPRPGRPPAEK